MFSVVNDKFYVFKKRVIKIELLLLLSAFFRAGLKIHPEQWSSKREQNQRIRFACFTSFPINNVLHWGEKVRIIIAQLYDILNIICE